MKKIIVVGNGFDLAHGLKTTYADFVKSNKNDRAMVKFRELVEKLNEEDFNNYFDSEDKNLTWYSFERHMERISVNMHSKNFEENGLKANYLEIDKKMAKYNKLFSKISKLLYEYFEEEYSNHYIQPLNYIKKQITKDSFVISFNYTDTIKLYTSDYYFVHGSINDDRYIILGFANGEISDLSTYECQMFDKWCLKEELNYVRYLIENKVVYIDNYLKEFTPHLKTLSSCRGGYDFPCNNTGEVCDTSSASDLLLMYAERNNFLMAKDRNDYSEVEEIVIIGHGLESDINYLRSIFDNSKMLKKVKLFTFSGEKSTEIDRKINRIKDFCNCDFNSNTNCIIKRIEFELVNYYGNLINTEIWE